MNFFEVIIRKDRNILKTTWLGIALSVILSLPCQARAQLFQLSTENGISGYVFGSTHAALGGVDVKVKALLPLIRQSNIVVLETANGIPLNVTRDRLSAPSGKTVFDMLPLSLQMCSKSAYFEMLANSKANEEVRYLFNLKPVFLAFAYLGFTLEKLNPPTSMRSYDRLISDAAKKYGKPIADLESATEKIDILIKFEPIDISSIIDKLCEANATRQHAELLRNMQSSIVKAYLRGDMNQLTADHRAMYRLLGVSDVFEDLFWVKRNTLMASKIAGLVRNGYQPFVAIGASHLGGSDGILEQLVEKGITISAIPYVDE